MIPVILLTVSILLSTGRNIFSKRISSYKFGSLDFFLHQSLIFLFGSISILLFGRITLSHIAPQTVLLALIYGTILLCAQWFYTAALGKGNTALCSTVYSMGFILPTVSGALLWNEAFTPIDFIGIIFAVIALLLSKKQDNTQNTKSLGLFFLPLLIAMLSSGGLGIIQKIQQSSEYSDERSSFLLIAFIFATAVSLIASFIFKKAESDFRTRYSKATAAAIGLFFGCCNMLNTTLAGMLPTAVFFPTLNIGIIFLSMLCGVLISKERITKSVLLVLASGSISIVLLNVF